MTFERLRQFISTEMRMSQVYQPVMLMELLKNKGSASASQIAQAILNKDPTQIEYFTEIVRNVVGDVIAALSTAVNGDELKGIERQLVASGIVRTSSVEFFDVSWAGKVEGCSLVYKVDPDQKFIPSATLK
jgi:hypothetical protein